MRKYKVDSRWVGWLGGFGSERDLERRLNALPIDTTERPDAVDEWFLEGFEIRRCLWFYLVPRLKMITIWSGVPVSGTWAGGRHVVDVDPPPPPPRVAPPDVDPSR